MIKMMGEKDVISDLIIQNIARIHRLLISMNE